MSLKNRTFSGKYQVKFGHFINVSYTGYFLAKIPPPKVDSAPTPMRMGHLRLLSFQVRQPQVASTVHDQRTDLAQ